ncbi:MAG: 50S ribosomal protein L22 [Deltaproteobacteria bacterium]|nr:50S ribosomal protein L22 [Candidatus Zymogenaceae bacterium]
MEMTAKTRFMRISPYKVRLVADMVRGKPVGIARDLLALTNKKASGLVKKLIDSAVANASQNKEIDVDNLYVGRIFVDQGPTWKRFRPRSMGRFNRILKRTSHITVVLKEK